jgi:hypothetical protein
VDNEQKNTDQITPNAPPADPLSWQDNLGTLQPEHYEPTEQVPDILSPADPAPSPAPQAATPPPAPSVTPYVPPVELPPMPLEHRRRRPLVLGGAGVLVLVFVPLAIWLSHRSSKPAEPLTSVTQPTATAALLVPEDVTLTPDDSGLTVSWQTVEGASAYQVDYSTDPNFATDVQTKTVKQGTSLHLNLTAGGRYYVRVAASSANSNSSFSDVQSSDFAPAASATENTPPPAAPTSHLAAPAKPSASSAGGDSLNVSWSGVAGAQKYRVEYTWRSDGFSGAFWQETTGTSLKLTELKSATKYYVHIAGYGGGSFGDWSTTVSATTQAVTAPAVPKMPSNVRLTPGPVANGGTFTYMDAVWTAGDSSARAEILWSGPGLLNQPRAPKGDGGGGATSDRANGLKPATTYCFQVREYNGSTPGPWTDKVCATTKSS